MIVCPSCRSGFNLASGLFGRIRCPLCGATGDLRPGNRTFLADTVLYVPPVSLGPTTLHEAPVNLGPTSLYRPQRPQRTARIIAIGVLVAVLLLLSLSVAIVWSGCLSREGGSRKWRAGSSPESADERLVFDFVSANSKGFEPLEWGPSDTTGTLAGEVQARRKQGWTMFPGMLLDRLTLGARVIRLKYRAIEGVPKVFDQLFVISNGSVIPRMNVSLGVPISGITFDGDEVQSLENDPAMARRWIEIQMDGLKRLDSHQ